MLNTYGLNIASKFLCDSDSGLVTAQRQWERAIFERLSFSDLSSPLLAKINVRVRYPFTGFEKTKLKPGQPASLYRIYGASSPFNETRVFAGVVERCFDVDEQCVSLDITTDSTFWAQNIPYQFSTNCRYTRTEQCTYAFSCAKSYAACTQNGKTAIFGGFRFIPPPGSRIIFREFGTTADGGDDGGGGRVVIPV